MHWPELTRENLLASAFAMFLMLSMSALYAAPLGINTGLSDAPTHDGDTIGNSTDEPHPPARGATGPVGTSRLNCTYVSKSQVNPDRNRTLYQARSPVGALANERAGGGNASGSPVRFGSANETDFGNISGQSQPTGLRGICQLADLYSAPEWVNDIADTEATTGSDTNSGGTATSLENSSDTTPRAEAQLALARDLRGILTDDSRSRRAATLDAASRTLAARQQLVDEGHLNESLAPRLAAEQTKLRGARTLVEVAEGDQSGQKGSISRASRLAGVGTKVQAARLASDNGPTDPAEVALPDTPIPDHDAPSAAAFAILEARNVEATPEQAADIRGLDELANPTRREVTEVLDAYLAYYTTTQETDGTDVQQIRAAQLQLLDESSDLQAALEAAAAPDSDGPASLTSGRSTVNVSGVVYIDLSTEDSTYSTDYMLQVDAGGDDTYNNNAGGAKSTGNSTDAAALIDLGGTDTYAGRNGGGWYNRTKNPSGPYNTHSPKEGEAAGFLLDAGTGDDTYRPMTTGSYLDQRWGRNRLTEAKPGSLGTNGGARRGIGFLVDTGGSDTYDAGGMGTNGGGDRTGVGFLLDGGSGDDTYKSSGGVTNGGSRAGQGFLYDAGGDDSYDANGGGSNGGGAGGIVGVSTQTSGPNVPLKHLIVDITGPLPQPPQKGGFLMDAGGTDSYQGSNGGGSFRGIGFLLDAGVGNDTYDGKNGGATRRGATGFLLDTGGSDSYQGGNDGTNGGAVNSGMGFLLDGGTGADTYDATTEGRPPVRSNLPAGSLGTNGGSSTNGKGALLDGGGDDSYIAGSVGTNGGAVQREAEEPNNDPRQYGISTALVLDVAGNDTYTAKQAGVNGGAASAVSLLYDNAGTDFYNEYALQCRDCSDVPKGFVGAQVDSGGTSNDGTSVPGSSETLVVDDDIGSGDTDCSNASYRAIQPAVNAAENGDTVRVCGGTYPGNVTVDTTGVTLRAADGGEVILNGENTRRFGVALVAGQTGVSGFRATNFSAGFIAIGPSTTVAHSTVTNTRSGIISTGLFTDSPMQETPLGDDEQISNIHDNTVTDARFGIRVSKTGNINISSNSIQSTQFGIGLNQVENVDIHDNTVSATTLGPTTPQRGISSVLSSEITISDNVVRSFTVPSNRTRQETIVPFGDGYGIEILQPAGVGEDTTHRLRNNTMVGNTYNLQVYSTKRGAYQYMDIDTSNTVNGQPVLYLVGATNVTIGSGPGATQESDAIDSSEIDQPPSPVANVSNPGYVACIQCVDVTIRDIEFGHNGQGVLIAKSRGIRVENVTVHDTWEGIAVYGSPTNTVVANNHIRESYVAVHARHDCGDRENEGFPLSQISNGNLALCLNTSLVIEDNTISETGWVFETGSLSRYVGVGLGRLPSFTGYGGAISVTGTGVTVRRNSIRDARGGGITMRVRKRSGFHAGFLNEGIKVNADALVESAVVNNEVSNAFIGISVEGSQGTVVRRNRISDVRIGFFNMFNRELIYRNNLVTNATTGLYIDSSDLDYRVRNNSFMDVTYGLHITFTFFENPPRAPASHDFGTTNTVNGERILWFAGATHRTIDATDANMVVCFRCVDVTVRDMTLTDNAQGVVFWETTNSSIRNVTVTETHVSAGILIRGGQNNVVRNSTITDSAVPIFAVPVEGRQSATNQREFVGPLRIVNNHIDVDDARYRDPRTQFGYQHPAVEWTRPLIPAHFGIWLMNPTVVTVRSNTVTDNRWGIVQSSTSLFPDACRPDCDPPAVGYDMRLVNNTIRHAREPTGLDRNNPQLVPPFGITNGISVTPNFDQLSNGSIVIHNNNLSAPITTHGGRNGLAGITLNANQAPSVNISFTDNTVLGYERSLEVSNKFDNSTVPIRRNRLVGAKDASVVVSGSTPGSTVPIHQNLLHPGKFGYGVLYGPKVSPGGHMSGGGSGGGGGMAHETAPLNATCNRWGPPSGPSSRRMTVYDPVTDEPADGAGSAVSRGHKHHVSNVHFHPWLGESPRVTCTQDLAGTPTPTPQPTATRTPWPRITSTPSGGAGPGSGSGTGTGPGNGTGPGPGSGNSNGGGQRRLNASVRVQETATPTATPPPTPTPEIVPGFGVSVWLLGFVLLVAVLATRRRDK